jgi:hypothetical protein
MRLHQESVKLVVLLRHTRATAQADVLLGVGRDVLSRGVSAVEHRHVGHVVGYHVADTIFSSAFGEDVRYGTIGSRQEGTLPLVHQMRTVRSGDEGRAVVGVVLVRHVHTEHTGLHLAPCRGVER